MLQRLPAPTELGLPPKFSEWRTGQLVAALRVLDALDRTDTVFLQAPPGVGKTPLSILLAKMASTPRTQRGKYFANGAVITTITKLLQQQYLDDFPGILLTATGRDNWTCLLDTTNTAAQAPCTNGWSCPDEKDCDYITQRDAANKADIAVLNTSFYTYEREYTSKFAGHDLGIFDEAHDLERTIMDFGSVWISKKLFERLGYHMPDSVQFFDGSPWAVFWDGQRDSIDARLDEAEEQLDEAATMARDNGIVDLSAGHGRLLGLVRDLKRMLRIRGAFATARRNPAEYVLVRNDTDSMTLKPVWGHSVQFAWPRKTVLMSGTILAPEFLAYCLGIDDFEYVDMASEFPATNRPLIYVPTVKMGRGAGDDDLGHLVRTMDSIIERRHLGQKGIIHTVSYKLRDEVMARSKWKSLMVTHNSQDRLFKLAQFKTMPDGYILVSPSMTTGVDLPEDQCRWQIIPKMPFPNRGDEVIRLRAEDSTPFVWGGKQVKLGQLAYAYATATPLIQAYGRAMRSETDWGYTYVLDSNFWHFQQEGRWGRLFPQWFREAIRYTNAEEL